MPSFLFRLAKAAPLLLLAAATISSSAQVHIIEDQIIQITHWCTHAGDNPAWAYPDFDDSHWQVAPEYPQMNPSTSGGTRWYRATFQVPSALAGQQLALGMGPLDEVYDVYVNGTLVGRWGSWQPTPRAPYSRHLVFSIPAGLLTSPTGHIAIRRWRSDAGLGWSTFALSGNLDLDRPPEIGPAGAIILQQKFRLAAGALLELPAGLFAILFLFASSIAFVLFSVQRRKMEFLYLGLAYFVSSATKLIAIPLSISHSIMARSWGPTLIVFVSFSWGAFDLLFLSVICPKFRRILQFGAVLIVVLSLLSAISYSVPSHGAFVDLWVDGVLYSLVVFSLIAAWDLIHQRDRGSLAIALCLLSSGIAYSVGEALIDFGSKGISVYVQAGPFKIDMRMIPDVLGVFVILLVLYLRFRDEHALQAVRDQELASARRMQELLLTAGEAVPAGFIVDAVYRPAREVGGDFYRSVPLDDGSLLVILGDVSGKGLDAALLVAVILGSLASETHRNPGLLLEHLNQSVMGRTAGGFITACCARFYPDGRVVLANAGHISPYMDGREVQLENGFPLGISAQATYSETEIRTTKPITFLSDGVVEARNATGELLGFERLAELTVKPAVEIADTAQRWGQEDDITVLTVAATLA